MTEVAQKLGLSVTVVICAYTEERWEDLSASINSLVGQVRPPEEILVVIDYNTALLSRVRDSFSFVTVIANEENRGLSGARNTGVRHATSSIVAFLDDDAAADPQWLERLLSAYDRPEVAGVGGLVVPRWNQHRPGWFPPQFDWVVGCCHSGMPATRSPVRNFVGANMSFRRDVLIELGGFTSSLGRVGKNAAGCEETELCIRATTRYLGAQLVYEPTAEVHHHVPAPRATPRYFFRRCYGEGRSKALVSSLAGAGTALSAERSYLSSTIPRAIAHALAETARGRPQALLAAGASLAGTAATVAGFVTGQAEQSAVYRGYSSLSAGLRRLSRRAELWSALIVLLGLGLWISVLHQGVPLSKMDDFGLVSVLPARYFIGFGLVLVSLAWWLKRKDANELVLFCHLLVLLAMIHLTPAVLYGTLRYSWAWKHVAIADNVIATHGVNLHQNIPALVAYQDWPGFFTLNAFLTSSSGLASALSYASWGPFINELLYLAPLLLIFRSFTTDKRIQWCGLLLFYLGNWVGQDYFSPQALALFFYLVVIALVLVYFERSPRALHPEQGFGPAVPARTRRLYYLCTVVLIVAIASTHQLTPFMLVSALVCLLLVRRLGATSLVVVASAAAFGWTFTAGHTFLSDNINQVLQSFGNFGSNAALVQVNGANATHGQIIIADIDRALTASIIVLGCLGIARHLRRPLLRRMLPAIALTLSPIVALAGNNYGGEIVFRVYLFALPFLALAGAMALFSFKWKAPRRLPTLFRTGFLGIVSVAFLYSYYGKEQGNYFPPAETKAFSSFYQSIPTGSYLTGLAGNFPWPTYGYTRFTTYWFTQVSQLATNQLIAAPLRALEGDMSPYKHAYVIFATSDNLQIKMTGTMPRGSIARIEHDVATSSRFHLVEHSSTTSIYELIHTRPSAS